jgi:hypothetical protein
MSDLFPNTKYIPLEFFFTTTGIKVKGPAPSQHFVCDDTYTPPVYLLQQFKLGATAAIIHFDFFTLSYIFTKVFRKRKFVL